MFDSLRIYGAKVEKSGSLIWRGYGNWLLAAVVSVVCAIYALTYVLNHDVAWWLFVAESMVDGESLYDDLVEINPPLYGYLSMVPVGLARGLGLEVTEIVKLYYLVVFLALAGWSANLLKPALNDQRDGPLAISLLVLILIGLPGVDWAQREHVMLGLFLPYLLTQTRRRLGHYVSPSAAAATGIAAGFGIALKPQFVLLWILFELTLWLGTGRRKKWLWRTELWLLAFVLAIYGGFVLLAYPTYIQLLIDARHLYTEFSSKPLGALLLRPSGLILLATAVFLWFHRHKNTPPYQYARDLLVFACAAWLVALLQAKGWAYHFYPTLAATSLAAMLLFLDQMLKLKRTDCRVPKARRAGTVLFSGVVFALLTLTIGGQIGYDNVRTAVLETQFEYLRLEGTKSLVIMSPRVPDSFPIVNWLDTGWASPFPHLWWLQAAHGNNPGSSAAPPVPKDSVELAFRDQLIERVKSMEPELVLIDTAKTARFSGAPFPYVAYMSQDARFRSLWKDYERTGAVQHFRVYSRQRTVRD